MTQKKPVDQLTTSQLIERMEKSKDFKYDDEAVELTRRLKAEGYAWKWSAYVRPNGKAVAYIMIITQAEADALRKEQEDAG